MDNTKQFQSISQRVLFAYQVAFSDFVPVQSDMVSDEGQRVLHNRMRLIQERLYDNPKLLGLPEDMDQAYPWELCNNRRPEWNQIYLSVYKSLISSIISSMY